MTRYVTERIAGQPDKRRIKDTKRGRYLRQSHGAEAFIASVAEHKCKQMNAEHEKNKL